MKKSIGPDKVKTAVFISGTGSNLKNLIKFSYKKNSPIAINLIISNKSDAKGLKYANQQKIEKKIINFNGTKIAEKKIINFLIKELLILHQNLHQTLNQVLVHPNLSQQDL